MKEVEKLIEGSEQLTRIFGYWPSFHDAEVIEFNLSRGDLDPEAGHWIFSTLTAKIHVWELTAEVDASGHYILRHPTLSTLRFHELDEFRMEGFNHQNAIFGLGITTEERESSPSPSLRVEFEPAFGLAATFRCARMEVLHAEPFLNR